VAAKDTEKTKKKRPTAEKRYIQSERRRIRNKGVKTYTKTMAKKVRQAPDKETAEKILPAAYSALDRAAKKNVIHPNKASRLKSRLAKATKTKAGTTSEASPQTY
jgi:small subunit ribosomal protein S20